MLKGIDFETPQEQRQTSPTSQALTDYKSYQHQVLPGLVRIRVEEVVYRKMQPFAAFMISNIDLAGIVRECQEQVSQEYRSRLLNSTSGNLPSETPIVGSSQNTVYDLGGLDQQQQLHSNSVDRMLPAFPPGEPLDWGMQFPSLPLYNLPNQSQEQYAPSLFADSGYSSQPANDAGSSVQNFSEIQCSALPQPRQELDRNRNDNLGSNSNFEQ